MSHDRLTEYKAFLANKERRFQEAGFHVEASDLNPALFDFQRYIVQRALKIGRFAIFSGTGTGKTLMQLEWANQVVQHTNQPVLILCPLCVSAQTIAEGERFGIQVDRLPLVYAGEIEKGIWITNYENLEHVNPELFSGVVLDESSIMKNLEGKTRTRLIDAFQNTRFKLPCTATPAPNDPIELGNHAQFLGVMSFHEMTAMYFINDMNGTAQWRLKKHAIQPFYDWVSTWAVMLSKPSDIGFSADGYDLPPLNLHEREIKTPERANGQLFNDMAVSATDFNGELRLTKIERLSEVVQIVNEIEGQVLIWIKQDEEGDYLLKELPGAIEVRGSMPTHVKESRLLGFARGEYRILITKSKIAGMGLNFQSCHNQIFASLDFSFEGLFQSIRRSWRFGQTHAVNVWLITTDTMQNVKAAIERKSKEFEKMQAAMTQSVNKNLHRKAEVKTVRENTIYQTDRVTAKLGDCIQLIQEVPDGSVDFSIYSPPFAELYVYSDQLEDLGNSKDYKEFLQAYQFLVEQHYRTIRSGRLIAVHCMDLPVQKGKEGYIGLRSFSGLIREAFERVGFIFHSEIVIWKDPVTAMQRTKAIGLLHKQIKKDAAMSRVGIPDKVLVFRHPGVNTSPIIHQDTDPGKPGYLPVNLWQQYASPVWMDINQSATLQKESARDEKDEKHICPLQLPVIERCIHLWTNENDLVLTPFGGIGSEAFQALKMNRRALLFELKESYFQQAVRNLKAAEIQKAQATLQLY
jgi:DNA modification methylase